MSLTYSYFLGLRNLSMIDDMIKNIDGFSKRSLYNINFNDAKTLNMLSNADTLGVFQLESDGIRNTLRKIGVHTFNDIVAVLALYRPGPMDIIDEYAQRKRGKPFSYIHDDLKPILSETFGFIVYQEQIMHIASKFAGFSLAEADILRRAVSKKNEDVLNASRDKFVKSSVSRGYSYDVANSIYDYIVKFANYGFNKSHSVAYAMVAYYMAYIKANHFDAYICNVLNNVISNKETLNEYILYARSKNIKIYKPNINVSTNKFMPTPNGIFMPLTAILSIGEAVCNEILKERKKSIFLSYDDFRLRCDNIINSNVMDALIFSGALDLFSKTKKEMYEDKEAYQMIFDKNLDGVISSYDEYEYDKLCELESKYLGFNLEYSVYKDVMNLRLKYKYKAINELKAGNVVLVAKIRNYKEIKTKNNTLMIVGDLVDDSGVVKFVMFSNEYNKFIEIINKKSIYYFLATYQNDIRNSTMQLVIKDMKLALK